jgi:NTE family protein
MIATKVRLTLWLAAIMVLAGCASRPVNEPIARADPASGYRPYVLIPKIPNNDPTTLFLLAFSGGGTRAAAFSYGVLEELRRTEIVADGKKRRLVDEVDGMVGVSGGSFTALSYALYGDRLFSEYEERFLKRDVQGWLTSQILNPFSWHKFVGGTAGRSDMAADYYDEILFQGATFGDLMNKGAPAAIAAATDISTGARFAFYQQDFDLICSDLSKMRLARAAATSSAVPVVLSAMTFNNYGGTCGYQPPAWARDVADPDARVRPTARSVQRYKEMQDFQDSKERPYIHLVDGGVADNIGGRLILESLEQLGASASFREEAGVGGVRRVVIIVVNARSSPRTEWDKSENPPGMVSQLLQSASVPIDRYSFETIEAIKDRVQIYTWRRDLRIAQFRLAGATEAEAEAKANAIVPNVDLYAVSVSFDEISDPQERAYFMELPTSFVLPPEAVDRLRDVAGRLMRQSPDYQRMVRSLGGTVASPGPAEAGMAH